MTPRAHALKAWLLEHGMIWGIFLFTSAMINTTTKNNLGKERIYFSLHFQVRVHHNWGKSGQELKQEPKQKPRRSSAY